MKPLTIELTKGARRQLQSVGWKAAREHDCRRHLFALAPDGTPLVVALKAAMPDYYDPNRQARAVFSCDPFPEAVCVEVSTCRLLAPPCYQSREDFEGQLPCHSTFEPWKWIYWQTHRQVLLSEPSDDGVLQERLDTWLAGMRAACEHEAGLWRDKIKKVTAATLKELGFDTEEQRAKRLIELQGQLDLVESEDSISGVPCKGRLKLTLADVKRGYEGIRDAWMHEDWAAKNGEDLALMLRERRVFRRWLETHTGTRANVFDMTTRERRQEISPPHFGERFESDPRFLEACAMVRYRARFADNANTVVYLADCELREEPTAEELDEIERLKAIAHPAQPLDSVKFRHSPNYRQLFWADNGNQEQANLTPKQASAFSALHSATGFILSREEWQQEIYGDEPPSDFRPDKLFDYGDGSKVWHRFVRVEGDRYRLIFERK